MLCWHCSHPAYASCAFCGRGVCKKHIQPKTNILAVYDEDSSEPQAIIVENAVWCMVCKPIPYPIAVPELERGKKSHGKETT